MNLIRPTTITDANLTSTDVPETDYAEYVPATTYGVGDTIIVVATHKIYESLQAANTGHYPPDNLTGATPWWLEIGATNAWRMFDTQVATITSQVDDMTIEVTPGLTNSIALLTIEAATVEITMTDPTDGIVYNETVNMVSDSGIKEWYSYFFEPIIRDTDIVRLTLPQYPSAVIKVEFVDTGGTVECGMMVVGTKKLIGVTKWEPQVSIIDYSRKETDDFGNPTLVVRKSARLLSADVFMPTDYANEARRALTEYRAVPVVWVGSEDFQSTIIYGFYRSFNIILSNYSTSDCVLEIEGLI